MAVSTIDALYNGGSEKISATSTGVDVTGTLTSDGLTIGSPSNPTSSLAVIKVADSGTAIQAFEVTNRANADFVFKVQTDLVTGGSTISRPIAFMTASTERMRIDSSGNVGIGATTVDSALHIEKTTPRITLQIAGNDGYNTIESGGVNELIFGRSGAENMRIDNSGNLLVGTTDPAVVTDGAVAITSLGVTNTVIKVGHKTGSITGADFVAAYYNNTQIGGMAQSGTTAVAFNTSSDYRLKTDAQPMTGASARVQALNPVNFEWIADGSRVDGFLAHEAQAVVPEAVTGAKDAMMDEEYEVTAAVYEDVVIEAVLDDEGDELEAERTEQNLVTEAVMGTRSVPDMQGIDQSKLVPLLTAALQEALTKIDDMETRLAALEG